MLEMLPEVIGTEELLTLVAFTELVNGSQMFASYQPIGLWNVCELFAAVPTHVVRCDGTRRTLWLAMTIRIWRSCRARVECSFEVAFERGARP